MYEEELLRNLWMRVDNILEEIIKEYECNNCGGCNDEVNMVWKINGNLMQRVCPHCHSPDLKRISLKYKYWKEE